MGTTRRKKVYGTCHICGKTGKLTFEHVPPKKAFNNQKKYFELDQDAVNDLKKILESKTTNSKYARHKQGGIGFYSICQKCNNDTGRLYARDFINWARQSMSILLKANNKPSCIYPTFIFPLRVIKQIVTMFIAFNDNALFRNQIELKRFILNPELKGIPSHIKIYTYYNIEGFHRYIQYSISGQFGSTSFIKMSELAYPPLGFVMTLNNSPSPDKRLTDITRFANYDYNEFTDVFQRFNTLPTYTPNLPGDYRSKEEIIDTINKNDQSFPSSSFR